MILTVMIVVGLILAILAGAAWLVFRLGLSLHQALLYLPLKILYRINDAGIKQARDASAPVIYVVTHQSRIDPALMLALLPAQTLHILDEASAKAMWLEPWRELARTIAFNAEHVFVSRRLVRHLRGKGRLAVYIPDDIDPSQKAFRLYRAIARIAIKAEASVVPIFVDGYRKNPPATIRADAAPRGLFPPLTIRTLAPATIAELASRSAAPSPQSANVLFDRVAEAGSSDYLGCQVALAN